jgi:hypothetical protein
MQSPIKNWFDRKIPPNLLLKYPLLGFFVIVVFSYFFIVVYTPFNTKSGNGSDFNLIIAVYALTVSFINLIVCIVLRRVVFKGSSVEGSIGRELLSLGTLLLIMGLSIYFLAFLIEPSADRWNFNTFLDSFKYAVFIGFLPYGVFSLINYPYWTSKAQLLEEEFYLRSKPLVEVEAEPIKINSKLKKEELEFFPEQLIYAIAEGNYVVFFLSGNGGISKAIIRNSMTEIEKQLESVPHFLRTHRAFIINLKKVTQKKGNTLGYRLRLEGIDQEIPVSRNKTEIFNRKFKEYQ